MPLPRPSENMEEWGNQIVDELENEIEKINQAANVNDNTSFAVTDSASTTLDGGINNSVTSIDLTSASNFPTSGTIVIESEQITYTGKITNELTG